MPTRWTLVTDDSAPGVEVQRFRDKGIEVVVVDRGVGAAHDG